MMAPLSLPCCIKKESIVVLSCVSVTILIVRVKGESTIAYSTIGGSYLPSAGTPGLWVTWYGSGSAIHQ